VRETPKGQIQPIYFDPYGCPPPQNIKTIIENYGTAENALEDFFGTISLLHYKKIKALDIL
jgi:hypothetical protein